MFRNVSKRGNLKGDSLWHHACITWRSSDGRYSIHVDGSKLLEGLDLARGVHIAPGRLVIGQTWEAGKIDRSKPFVGSLSHFNMWNSELSDEQINRMSLGCGAEIGNLIPWPEMKAWKPQWTLVNLVERSSCLAKGWLSFFQEKKVFNWPVYNWSVIVCETNNYTKLLLFWLVTQSPQRA